MSSYGAADFAIKDGTIPSQYQLGRHVYGEINKNKSVIYKVAVGAVLLLSGIFAVSNSNVVGTTSRSELVTAKANSRSAPTAEITDIKCGYEPKMVLACEVQVASENAVSIFLEYQPSGNHSNTRIRTPDFKVTQQIAIQLFRLRPATKYDLHLYVVLSGGDQLLSGTTTFTSESTGYPLFDAGSINEIQGVPNYPLLLFALHTLDWRGVVATDQAGYVIWYYNSTMHFASSHIEAVEQSKLDYVFCVNDQGYQGNGKSVRIIDALGRTLSASKNANVQGHECRITDDKKVLLTSIGTKKTEAVQQFIDFRYDATYEVSEYTTEYVDVWDPAMDGTRPEEQILLNKYFSWETLTGFYTALTDGNNGRFQWQDLYLEYSIDHNKTNHVGDNSTFYNLRYLHPSSISVSEDGMIYVVSFRDSHIVLGIDRKTGEKKFLLSSVVPSIATHNFVNDFHKFYAPHDVSYHTNNTLCLMDDGVHRPQGDCTDDDVATCFSRAVCYYLNDEKSTAELKWQFEYPSEIDGYNGQINISTMRKDVFNLNGGSLRKWGLRDYVVAYTSIMFDRPFNHSAWVFNLHETNPGTVEIASIVKIPKSHNWATSQGTSGSYRATPILSINGEYSVAV